MGKDGDISERFSGELGDYSQIRDPGLKRVIFPAAFSASRKPGVSLVAKMALR